MSFVVTGGAQGVGRAIAGRLARQEDVIVLDTTPLDWSHERVTLVRGDRRDSDVARLAVATAERQRR